MNLKISFNENPKKQQPEFVLLDDDKELLNGIQSLMTSHNLKVHTFSDYNLLKESLHRLDPKTIFLIDKNLGNEDGFFVGRDIHFLGFKNVYLLTGDDSALAKKSFWLAGTICKTEVDTMIMNFK